MAKWSTRRASAAAGVVGLAVAFAVPSTAQATTRTISGGAGADVIRHFGRAYDGATLELVACVNGTWVFYGTLSTSDQVVVTRLPGSGVGRYARVHRDMQPDELRELRLPDTMSGLRRWSECKGHDLAEYDHGLRSRREKRAASVLTR